jgi:hypothetical protein
MIERRERYVPTSGALPMNVGSNLASDLTLAPFGLNIPFLLRQTHPISTGVLRIVLSAQNNAT